MLPPLGRRGGGWVVGQVVLIAAVVLSAWAGRGWPSSLEVPAEAVGGLLVAGGLGLLAAGGRWLGSALTPFPAPREGHELRTNGVYARARHPMYGGSILVALGWATVFASLVGLGLAVVVALFLELKSRREELWLVEHRPTYADYRRRTRRRFVPFVW